MQRLSDYLATVGLEDGAQVPAIAHWCPGCHRQHQFAVESPQENGARWTWDGNTEQPTFSPSMSIKHGPGPCWEPGDGTGIEVCHYFLRAGQIEFLEDCTHFMRGRTVPLPRMPALWTPYARTV
jgi:hypothetical protein